MAYFIDKYGNLLHAKESNRTLKKMWKEWFNSFTWVFLSKTQIEVKIKKISLSRLHAD